MKKRETSIDSDFQKKMTGGRAVRFVSLSIIGLLLITLPLFTDLAIVSLFTKILIFGLLAMSLDILVGYAGLWSFCHAALFGVGAYTTGIMITRLHITSFLLSAPAGVLMTVLVACLFGAIALRVSALYFLLITFALGQLIYTVAIKWEPMTGGADGLVGVPYPDIGFSLSMGSFYYFVLVVVIICTIVLYLITKSPIGLSLQGMRESTLRMRCLGYNTWFFGYIAFIIGGLFAGIAGVLYIYFNGLIVPTNVDMSMSGLVFLMLILGGSGTLWGGLIGSAVILLLQYFISIFTPERWPLILGACFVAAVMFLSGGLFPRLRNLLMKLSRL